VLTPAGCAHWEGQGELWYTDGLPEAVVLEDQMDRLWLTYYRSIFNPARVKEKAMLAEMPQKYWKHLPEAQLIPSLMLEADQRVGQMLQEMPNPGGLNCGERPATYDAKLEAAQSSAAAGSPEQLHAGIHRCRNCSLWAPATQAVTGEGPVNTEAMIIGEQPGDQEDLEGKPFIGPAGQLLDQVLESLGVQRESLYVTNAVKHFKFKATPKRRLHERPKAGEIDACRPWLLQEITNVSPKLIICLGATAARSLLGRPVSVSSLRGKPLSWRHFTVVVALHPAAVLRAPDREAALATLTEDLERAFSLLPTL
jgi:DNA polymerase